MPSTATLRIEIERALDRRFPAALTPVPRTISETTTTGIPEVDALLDGGFPVGAISEVTGPQSSGRTGLALSFLTQQTQDERVCAWVDAGTHSIQIGGGQWGKFAAVAVGTLP